MTEWKAVAHRGEFALEVVTATRARDDGLALHEGMEFIGVILRYGEDPVLVAFAGLPRVAAFIAEMKPLAFFLKTGEGEDPAPWFSAFDDLLAGGVSEALH